MTDGVYASRDMPPTALHLQRSDISPTYDQTEEPLSQPSLVEVWTGWIDWEYSPISPAPKHTSMPHKHAHMHACTHAHTHTHTHTNANTHTHARTHARIQACTHARTHARTHAGTHARTHARTHAYKDAHTYAHMNTHAASTQARTHARMNVHTLWLVGLTSLLVPLLPPIWHLCRLVGSWSMYRRLCLRVAWALMVLL
jgi:hypothetical protein